MKKSAKEMKSKRKDDMSMCVRERWYITLNVLDEKKKNFSSGECKFLFPVHSALYATSNHGNEMQRSFVSIF